jgi:hypothetical protein
MRHRAAVAVLLLAGILSSCKSAGPKAPTTTAARDLSALERAYVGQKRILIRHADQAKLPLKRKDIAGVKPGCQGAVEVRSVSTDKGTVRLGLELLGRPRLRDSRGGYTCKVFVHEMAVTISGYGAGDGIPEMTADLDQLLLTPEAFLAQSGVSFTLSGSGSAKPVADAALEATIEERRLAREVKTWVAPLLSVEPTYYDPRRKVRHQGEVTFTAIVGTDGRLHEPRVTSVLGNDAQSAHIAGVLPLWRLEPARKADRTAVASRLNARTVLHIY